MISVKEVQSSSSGCPEIHEVSDGGLLIGFVEKMPDSRVEAHPWTAYAKSNVLPGRVYIKQFYSDQKNKRCALDNAINALLSYVKGCK